MGAAGRHWVLPHPRWLSPGSWPQAALRQCLQLPHPQPGIWVAFLSPQVLFKIWLIQLPKHAVETG